MIKVNLYAKGEKKKLPVVGPFDLNYLNFFGLFVAVIVYYGADIVFIDPAKVDLATAKNNVAKANKALQDVERDLKKNAGNKLKLEEFKKRLELLKSRKKQVEDIIAMRSNPYKLLERVARNIPQDLWLDSIEITDKKQIIMKGESLANSSVGLFKSAIDQSAFFKDLKIDSISTIEDRSNNRRVEKFSISGDIKTFDPWRN